MRPLTLAFIGWCDLIADFTFQMPDRPSLVQNLIWPCRDLAPNLPKLNRLIEFWQMNLDGKLVKVVVAVSDIYDPRKTVFAQEEISF